MVNYLEKRLPLCASRFNVCRFLSASASEGRSPCMAAMFTGNNLVKCPPLTKRRRHSVSRKAGSLKID